ncbi:hypothetical protein SJ05684_c06390 [Sinorhizobium sojae CCBAU 05684]|uniref:Uncharacterized protein n=1 Tax=Sinorhizobium sojae CCBAU 05684 TaxID=716928 RepID=A0A249P848_9HYPH|nr:hypothetical protein SJ05684_c06390 [Sinorhizobium sojae CCBAU 05684]
MSRLWPVVLFPRFLHGLHVPTLSCPTTIFAWRQIPIYLHIALPALKNRQFSANCPCRRGMMEV